MTDIEFCTALQKAIKEKNEKEVRRLAQTTLPAFTGLGAASQCDFFCYACKYGNLEIAKFLKKKTGKTSFYLTALKNAILSHNFDIADWLQEEFNVDCSIQHSFLLSRAAEDGNLPAMEYTLSHGALVNDGEGQPFYSALFLGQIEAAKFLLVHGADLKKISPTIFIKAVEHGTLEDLKLFQKHGANLKAAAEELLISAVLSNKLDCVKFFLPHSKFLVKAAQRAAEEGNLEALKLIVEHSKKASKRLNEPQLVIEAIFQNNIEMLDYLMSQLEVSKEEIFLYAVEKDNVEALKVLTNYEDPRKFGERLMSAASKKKSFYSACYLARLGISVDTLEDQEFKKEVLKEALSRNAKTRRL